MTAAHLDLASLATVRAVANALRSAYERIDLLINNAGVMMTPYGRTEDGFERQLGVNHLGPFALTGLLLDRMLTVAGSRVVTSEQFSAPPGPDRLRQPVPRARVPALGRLPPVQAGQPAVHVRTAAPGASGGGHGGAGGPSRVRADRAVAEPAAARRRRRSSSPCSRRAPRWARCRFCAPPPIPRPAAASITAPVADRHDRLPRARPVGHPFPRRGPAAPPVGGVRTADRRNLPGSERPCPFASPSAFHRRCDRRNHEHADVMERQRCPTCGCRKPTRPGDIRESRSAYCPWHPALFLVPRSIFGSAPDTCFQLRVPRSRSVLVAGLRYKPRTGDDRLSCVSVSSSSSPLVCLQ